VYLFWTPPASAAANNYIEVAGLQYEIGSRATAFDMRSFDDELAACQRYYQKTFNYSVAPAQNTGDTSGSWTFAATVATTGVSRINSVPFHRRMRTTPVLTFYNPSAANAFARNLIRSTDATATSASGAGETRTGMSVTGVAGWAVNDLCAVHYTATAEL
jgi:hypothetical protein